MTGDRENGAPRIGFMQGRVSPLVNGKIQAFPAASWQTEFEIAKRHGYPLIEWTLDHDGLGENPLMTAAGRQEISELSVRDHVEVASVTADCFMQAPFFKSAGQRKDSLLDELRRVLAACNAAGVTYLVVPLVDGGSIASEVERETVLRDIGGIIGGSTEKDTQILFESDFEPDDLKSLIDDFASPSFGINYDIGNSAAAGFDAETEIATYGMHIRNVHVKDRLLGGTTVPLGAGNAAFTKVMRALRDAGYDGDYILQTARADDGDHVGALNRYRDMVGAWLRETE